MDDPVLVGGPEARPLPPELVGVLQDLAQALLNLEHALCFYPEGHQARQAPLERLLALLQAEAAITGAASLHFSGELLYWRGLLFKEMPAAARKLAALLGNKGIARLSWSPGLTAVELERFLALLARGRGAGHRQAWDPAARFENLRADGPDYQALMAQSAGREAGLSAERRNLWQALLLRTLSGPEAELAAWELELLRERWDDPAALAALLVEALGPAAPAGDPDAAERVGRFAGFVERAAAAGAPLPEGECARKLAALARQLPAALRLRLLEATLERPAAGFSPAAFGSLDADETAALIAETFALAPGRIGRLARIFQHLVPRQLERMELAPRLREGIRRAGDPEDPLADNAWEEVQELLTGEAGEFLSPGYQEQLRRLALREEARRGAAHSLAELPDLVADLAAVRIAGESLLIQFEQLRLATGVEQYRDALEGVCGLCGAALAAGDRERGVLILQRLLEMRAGEEPLAGPRPEIERAVRAIAGPAVIQALITPGSAASPEQQAAARTLFALAADISVPVLLDALAAAEDPARRREIATLLQGIGPGAIPEALRRLEGASASSARTLLPIVAEARDPGAVPVLLGLLRRDDPTLRRDAVRALLAIDSAAVRRALPELLEDRDEEIVQAAAIHLGASGSPETVGEQLLVLRGGRFSGQRLEQVQRAIFVLGRMRAAAAVVPLGELLLRRTWINRKSQEDLGTLAAQALARIGGAEAKKSLELGASRASEKVAAACRRLLARWEGGE